MKRMSFSSVFIGYNEYEFRRTRDIAPEREPMRDPFEETLFPVWCITPITKRAARLSDIQSAIEGWIVTHPDVEVDPGWYEWIQGRLFVRSDYLSGWLLRLDVAYDDTVEFEFWSYGTYGPENTIAVWKRGVRPSCKEPYER